jgi:hypothetical protein
MAGLGFRFRNYAGRKHHSSDNDNDPWYLLSRRWRKEDRATAKDEEENEPEEAATAKAVKEKLKEVEKELEKATAKAMNEEMKEDVLGFR